MLGSATRVVTAFSAILAASCSVYAEETALDRYVKQPDATYSWRVVREVKTDGGTQFVVDLKSQTWRTTNDVNQPIWQHWLTIVKPQRVASTTAFLFISGGANGGEPPAAAEDRTMQIARATNSVAIELKMVPNQPLVFHGDGHPRKEDDLIGYTWDQFLKTGDETWPARLPMVKSVVRAMDCVQELLASEQGGRTPIEKFVVAGGSKRGWTTWCTAAVDKRVAAIVPIVIDVLNVNASMRHHVGAYGFYSLAINDYVQHKIMQRMHDPMLTKLYEIEDPYSYRQRLTMPKLIVNATGDEFFCPDSSQFYFNGLSGERHLRYVPNSNHSLRDTDALESIIAFYQLVLMQKARPDYTWSLEQDGSIRVQTQTLPKQVNLWQASNPAARDFRLAVIGKAYTSQTLEPQADGRYVGRVTTPESGWTAFFIELVYDCGVQFPLKLTTGVRVLPEKLPFANVDPATAPLESRPNQ